MITLTNSAKSIIINRLNISSLEDIIDKEYQDIDKNNDIDRVSVDKYTRKFRGSVRLRRGKFYTFKEYLAREKRIKALQLP